LYKVFYLLVAIILTAPRTGNTAELPHNAEFVFGQAVAGKPTVHDVGERIRIAKGLDPGMIAEFTGIHESVSFPGDTDPDADDFREDAYAQLRSEIRMAYAELASTRGQIVEVKRGVDLLRQMVETSTGLFANGKLDQAQVLKTQIEWERLSDSLLLLEKRQKIFSIRLNVLTGASPEDPVPGLETLREYLPGFDNGELIEAYKSRRFMELFQKLIQPDNNKATTGEGLHGTDSLETESSAFIPVVRISLESLYQQARRFRTSIIPRYEMAHSARLELYKNGKLDYSSLLEGLVALSDVRREYQALLGEAHVLKSKVEYLTGVSLD